MSIRLDLEGAKQPGETSEWPMSCGVVLVMRPYDATVPYAAQWEAEVPEGAIEPQRDGEGDQAFRERVRDTLKRHDRGQRLVRYMVGYGARAIVAWRGVLDKSGRGELPFSREAWELFLKSVPGALQEWQLITDAWERKGGDAVREAEGNGLPSGSDGTMDLEGEKSAPDAEMQDSPVPADSPDQPREDDAVTTGSTSRAA